MGPTEFKKQGNSATILIIWGRENDKTVQKCNMFEELVVCTGQTTTIGMLLVRWIIMCCFDKKWQLQQNFFQWTVVHSGCPSNSTCHILLRHSVKTGRHLNNIDDYTEEGPMRLFTSSTWGISTVQAECAHVIFNSVFRRIKSNSHNLRPQIGQHWLLLHCRFSNMPLSVACAQQSKSTL